MFQFMSELAGATLKVSSSRVYWWELLGMRQELGEGGERRLVKKNTLYC